MNIDVVAAALWHAQTLRCSVLPLWGTNTDWICRCPDGAECKNKPGKHPNGKLAPRGAHSAVADPNEIRRLLSGQTAYGLVPPNGVVIFDLDGKAVETWERLIAENGPTPPSWGQTTKHGRHLAFQWPVDGPADPGGNIAGIVTRRSNGYVVGPRSEIAGHVYEPDLGPDGMPLTFAALPLAWAEAVAKSRARSGSQSKKTRFDCGACGLLEECYGENERYPAILSLTMRLHRMGHSRDVQWEHVFAHLAPRFDPTKTESDLRNDFDRATKDSTRMDQMAAAWHSEHPSTPGPPGHLTRQSLAAYHFAEMAGDRVRYDHGRKRWLVWLGHRWQPDEDGSVQRLWLEVLATRYAQALHQSDDRERTRLAGEVRTAGALNSAITAGLSIASSMEPIATSADAWDPDPWVLGAENGVVDLRTGHLRPGRPEEMISRSTGIRYDADSSCPRWTRFLTEVFAGDEELADWFGLFVGASLIGTPKELIGIHFGLGNNGKSVAFHALLNAIGEYAVAIPVETLVNAKRAAGGATPDLMALRGARIAFTSEPDQASKLQSGVLKQLASVDRMTGRPLYGTNQTWAPTHTLHLSTNHLPAVDDATDGFWRRVALVPWLERFRKPGEAGNAPPEDPDLTATLALEAPGILAWAVRGAVAFAAGRALHPFPAAIRLRTESYRADEDRLGEFVTEHVMYERGATVAVGALYKAYKEWCVASDIEPIDRLGQKLFARGFQERGHGVARGRDAKNRVIFIGAGLRASTDPEHPEHPTPDAGTPHTKDVSEETRQVPPDAPDAPETFDVGPGAQVQSIFGSEAMGGVA